MSTRVACPEPDRLRRVLADEESSGDDAEVRDHLDSCPSCQRSLEDLAGEPGWRDRATHMNRSRPPTDLSLRQAMENLRHDASAGEPTANSTAADEVSLDFLDPPTAPDQMGRLGQYGVVEVIGRGGCGVVLKAFDPPLNRFVAIKVLAPQLATSAAARKRFAREAQAAAAVSHEHVVAIHGVDEVRGLPYIVMAYVPGRSLQERIDQSGPLELVPILRIGMQTAAGLAAAHAQGLIHRDVKPANILLEDDVDRVKITDFGLARAADDASLTQSGMVAGTPEYMSPEQAGGHAVDHRSDLFSLGSVLYSMTTGRPPFRAESAVAVLRRVCDHEPHPIHELNPAIPDWLAAIIAKLHAKQPAERFQSAADVSDLLGQCLAHVQQPRTAPLPRAAKELARARARQRRSTALRRRLTFAAAAVLLLFGGLGLTEATGVTNLTEFMGQIVRVVTPRGTLVIETDDPSIHITVDGENVTIDGTGLGQLTLRPGSYQMQATKDGTLIHNQPITISRGGRQVVKVTLHPPELADVRGARDQATVSEVQMPEHRATGKKVSIYAPEDGVVEEVLVDHGRIVEEGTVLVRLRNESIELEIQKVEKEIGEAAERVWAAEKNELKLLDDQIAALRTELAKLRQDRLAKAIRIASLTVRSPVSGQIATWEPKRTLVGRPVKRGEELLNIAELSSTLRDANRTYRVQEGDTLASIARQQLGAATRWQEIFSLNRDKLSEPRDLRAGMELRLAVPAAASTQNQRSATSPFFHFLDFGGILRQKPEILRPSDCQAWANRGRIAFYATDENGQIIFRPEDGKQVAEEIIRDQRWVVITALFPHHEQRKRYCDALHTTDNEPEYRMVRVERREQHDDGSYSDWASVDLVQMGKVVRWLPERWELENADLLKANAVFTGLVMKLPKLVEGEWSNSNREEAIDAARKTYWVPKPAPRPGALDRSDAKRLLVRFIDYTVDPGGKYQYRLKVVVNNPNYNRLDVVTAAAARPETLESTEWSDPSQVVNVPAEESLDVTQLDAELIKAADTRIVRALRITKDCAVISHIPNWDHGEADNIAVESSGARTLVDWQPIPPDEAQRADRRFLLALYSRQTLWNPPDDTIVAHRITTDWPERTSWKNQPPFDASPVAQFKLAAGPGWKLFNITPLVRAQAERGRKGFGVMLRFAIEDLKLEKPDFSTYRFVSREGDREWLQRHPVLLVVEAN